MHNIQMLEYSVTTKQSEIEADINDFVSHETYAETGGSGLCNSIRWIDKIFDCENEARNYIEKNDRGWYDNLAVKFKKCDYDDYFKNKKYAELVEKIKALTSEINLMDREIFFKTLKSDSFTCKECCCKIPTKRWEYNYCPVCKTDLRSQTFQDRLNTKKAKIETLKKLLKEEEKKCCQKYGTLRWLVKFEYHT